MSDRRIGELNFWGFLLSTVTLFLIAWLIFRLFSFQHVPAQNKSNETRPQVESADTLMKERLKVLEERIQKLESLTITSRSEGATGNEKPPKSKQPGHR